MEVAKTVKQDIDLKCPQCGSKCEWLDSTSMLVCHYCGYQRKYTGSSMERVIKPESGIHIWKRRNSESKNVRQRSRRRLA